MRDHNTELFLYLALGACIGFSIFCVITAILK